jgi:hypothetical protein
MGRAEARAGAVAAVIRVRGISVSDTDRERFLAERELARLKRWLEPVILVMSVPGGIDEPCRSA